MKSDHNLVNYHGKYAIRHMEYAVYAFVQYLYYVVSFGKFATGHNITHGKFVHFQNGYQQRDNRKKDVNKNCCVLEA